MALYFGTAAQGTDHYTSSQAAELNGSLVGPGVYLLERGDGLRASLVDANTVRISSGLMLVNGRHVGVEGHHDVTLENGAPGVSRIAKVVLRVTTGQVEGIEAKVYQGTPTAGEPEVPEHAEASLWELGNVTEVPVCTVRIEGIVPEDPVMLLPEVTPSLETLIDDVEEALAGKAPTAHSHGTSEIIDLAVTTEKLAAGSVTSAKIADGTIATGDLADASVTAVKLAASAVQAAKIANGAVTLDKLAANSVNAAKIVDGSVGTAELANGSVTSAKIADGTIANADIANATIDFSKLNAAAKKRVTDLESFRDSVSRTTLYAAGGWYVQRAGGFVWVMAKDVKTGSGSWDKVACPYALPAGMRPSVDIQVPMLTANGGSWTGYMTVMKTGAIEVGNYGNAGSADKRTGIAVFPTGL